MAALYARKERSKSRVKANGKPEKVIQQKMWSIVSSKQPKIVIGILFYVPFLMLVDVPFGLIYNAISVNDCFIENIMGVLKNLAVTPEFDSL